MTVTNVSSSLPLAEPGPIVPTATAASLAWKKVATETALNFAELRGLGRSKKQRIIDMLPTMGDFEKQRKLAIQANRHFSQMLPKGVGEDVADELIDRAIAWRARWEVDQAKKASAEQADVALASGEGDPIDSTMGAAITASDTTTATPTDAGIGDTSNVLDDVTTDDTDADSSPTTISTTSPVDSPVETPIVVVGGEDQPPVSSPSFDLASGVDGFEGSVAGGGNSSPADSLFWY